MPDSYAYPKLEELEQLAREAGRLLMSRYGKTHDIRMKGMVDLVTEADHLSEAFILGYIKNNYPSHLIVSEEAGSNAIQSDHAWYIDPLDGTVNFAHGIPIFSVSIAYSYQGNVQLGVVYDPSREECFSAESGCGAKLNGELIHVSETHSLIQSLLVTGFPYEKDLNHTNNLDHYSYFSLRTRGVRRLGSAAIDLCYVASGRFDGYWELVLNSWDYAAGSLIANEAGAKVTTASGQPLVPGESSSVLVANPSLHSDILQVLLTNQE